jgi:hypothetical protein
VPLWYLIYIYPWDVCSCVSHVFSALLCGATCHFRYCLFSISWTFRCLQEKYVIVLLFSSSDGILNEISSHDRKIQSLIMLNWMILIFICTVFKLLKQKRISCWELLVLILFCTIPAVPISAAYGFDNSTDINLKHKDLRYIPGYLEYTVITWRPLL